MVNHADSKAQDSADEKAERKLPCTSICQVHQNQFYRADKGKHQSIDTKRLIVKAETSHNAKDGKQKAADADDCIWRIKGA